VLSSLQNVQYQIFTFLKQVQKQVQGRFSAFFPHLFRTSLQCFVTSFASLPFFASVCIHYLFIHLLIHLCYLSIYRCYLSTFRCFIYSPIYIIYLAIYGIYHQFTLSIYSFMLSIYFSTLLTHFPHFFYTFSHLLYAHNKYRKV